MSSKPKKKTVKTKKKTVTKAKKESLEPLKTEFTDEEINSLRNKYNDILLRLSNFLSDHTVYEAVPDNVKIIVFNSELSFLEMIKVFIMEDVYCGLIYDPKMNYYLGLITTRDLMILYNYIFANFPKEKIKDFKSFLKKIFNPNNQAIIPQNKLIDNIDEKILEANLDYYNIMNYLIDVNYIDYLSCVKKRKTNLIRSVTLDNTLFDTLELINKNSIHRLLVEQENKIFFKLRKNKLPKKTYQENDSTKENTIETPAKKITKKKKSVTAKKITENLADDSIQDSTQTRPKTAKKKIVKKKKKIEDDTESQPLEKSAEIKPKKVVRKSIKKKEETKNEENIKKIGNEVEIEISKMRRPSKLNIKDLQKFNQMLKEDEKEEEETDNQRYLDKLKSFEFSQMKNYTGLITNETIYDYLMDNYYSKDMKEFKLNLNELFALKDIFFITELKEKVEAKEKIYKTFDHYLHSNIDLIPIYNEGEVEGFIYPKDFLYYIYNCESNPKLTNEEFMESLYEGIGDEKPYGKERIIYLEINDENKRLNIKELMEKMNNSIEKKIVLYDKEKLYIISLKTVFGAIVRVEDNNNKRENSMSEENSIEEENDEEQ